MLEQFMKTLLKMSITGGIVTIAILPLQLLFRKLPKKVTVYLWLLVLFRLLCPVSISTPVSTARLLPTGMYDFLEFQTGEETKDISSQGEEYRHGSDSNTLAGNSLYRLLFFIWMIGLLAFTGLSFVHQFRFKQLLQDTPLKVGSIIESDRVTTPFQTGVLSPKVFLPAGTDQIVREHILLHENIHIRYGDAFYKRIAFAVLLLHWFNPLVWLAFILLSKDLEMACDERVLLQMDRTEQLSYADSLLQMANRKQRFMGELQFSSYTANRIRRIIGFKRPSFIVSVISVLLLLAAMLVFGTNAADRKSNQIVLTNGITIKQANWSEDTMHQKCVDLHIEQRGGYEKLEKDGVPYEHVQIGAVVLGKKESGEKDWQAVSMMSAFNKEIQEESETVIRLYPQEGSSEHPKDGTKYCLNLELRIEYQGWGSLDPQVQKTSPAPDIEQVIVEIK